MQDLDRTKRVSLPGIAGLVAIHFALVWIVNLVVFPSGVLHPVWQVTGGWVNVTLLANLAMLILEVAVYLRWIAGVPSGDIGLRREKVVPALAGTFLYWLALNGLHALFGWLFGSGVAWNGELFRNPGLYIGEWIGQLFGNALLEEVLFRGVLFVQILLVFDRMASRKKRLTVAIFLSQGLFALFHIPNRIYQGYQGWEYALDFLSLLLLGVFFVLIYIWTNNLLFAVGVHALLNAPTLLFEGMHDDITGLAGLLLLMIILAGWRWNHGRFVVSRSAAKEGAIPSKAD